MIPRRISNPLGAEKRRCDQKELRKDMIGMVINETYVGFEGLVAPLVHFGLHH